MRWAQWLLFLAYLREFLPCLLGANALWTGEEETR